MLTWCSVNSVWQNPPSYFSSSGMTKRIVNAKIACLDFSLQKAKMKLGVQVVISDPEKLDQIRQRCVEAWITEAVGFHRLDLILSVQVARCGFGWVQEVKNVLNVNISQQYQILMEEVFTSGGRTSIKTVFKKCKYVCAVVHSCRALH